MKKAMLINCLLVLSALNLFSQQNDFPKLTGPYLGQTPPGMTPEIFAPGIVSTNLEHSAAMFTLDGKEVWFGRLFPNRIYYMEEINEIWSEPKIAPFCDNFNYLYPGLTQDGLRIFFSSDLPIEQYDKHKTRGERHIWMVERTSVGWTVPKRLGDNINFSNRNSFGSIVNEGNLYFSARVKGMSTEIFCINLVDCSHAVPKNLTVINSPEPEHCPFVSPDEKYLIFSSFRGGHGRSDLFISFRNSDGTWNKPRNMGPTINSAYKDEYPYVTSDGKYLFFNSNRPSNLNQKPIEDGPGNIYWIDARIIEELKQEE